MALKLKQTTRITTALFVLALPLLLFTFNLRLAINSLALYEYGFNRYGVASQLSLTPQELRQEAQELIRYLNSGDEEIMSDLFNAKEKIHLGDVQGLVHLVNYVLMGSLAYGLGYAAWHLGRRQLGALRRRLLWGCGLTLGLFLALGLGSLLGFDRLYLLFHLLSFSNPLWMLDPATDKLIVIISPGFQYSVALLIIAATVVEAATIGSLAWRWKTGIKKLSRPKAES